MTPSDFGSKRGLMAITGNKICNNNAVANTLTRQGLGGWEFLSTAWKDQRIMNSMQGNVKENSNVLIDSKTCCILIGLEMASHFLCTRSS